MPGKKIITNDCNCEYIYDGTIAGFFCCVYESVYKRQMPYAILAEGDFQPSLLAQVYIETNMGIAERVKQSIPKKISKQAQELIETVFVSCLEEKELNILKFLLLGYEVGHKVVHMLGHPLVSPLLDASKHLNEEANLLKGFVRFSDYNGFLGATITPKNFALPFISEHFITRFSCENFIIFDKTNKAALIYQNGKAQIAPMQHIEFPEVSEEEANYRSLWKQFYKTIAIEARTNPKCRMAHMPKRYWENMLEVKDLL